MFVSFLENKLLNDKKSLNPLLYELLRVSVRVFYLFFVVLFHKLGGCID